MNKKTKDRVIIFDTTLRDGEQSPGASMNVQEKLRLARQLEGLGVDVIEAGFPAASPGDLEAVSQIAKNVTKAEVAALARTGKKDIGDAWAAVRYAAKPRIHVFIATSDIHLEHKLKISRQDAIKKAVAGVRYAKKFTSNVEFSAEDGSRSDRDFLCKIFEAAIEAGATTVNLPDTVGYAIPDEFKSLVKYVIAHTPNIHKAILSVHCHNDQGLATANTLTAVQAGARQVEVTVNGIGERAGNTSLEEVVMTIKNRPEDFRVNTGINTKLIYPTSRLVSMISGIIVQPNKAIVGANAFAHEAGIHQDGVLKNPMTYEIMKPEDIGLDKNKLILGKHSGSHAIKVYLEKIGYKLTVEQLVEVVAKFKEFADDNKEVSGEELEAMAIGSIRKDDFYKLKYIHVTAGNTIHHSATIEMEVGGRLIGDNGFGNGPIDAAFNTISKIVGNGVKLERLHIDALSGGTNALGKVTVVVSKNGSTINGRGSDKDVITASAKAYIHALNLIKHKLEHIDKLVRCGSRLGEPVNV